MISMIENCFREYGMVSNADLASPNPSKGGAFGEVERT